MNPQCARCKKTVYPMEKLNCLDKSWHKGCFNCEVCHMKLTMQTYKGYSKLPYCKAHYPTTKFTAVADTPENRRLQQNTKQQSNLEYHKEYEKERAAYTVAQDKTGGYQQAPPPAQQQGYRQEAQGYRQEPQGYREPPQDYDRQPPPPVAPAAQRTADPQCVAMYSYTAADTDEVSFNEGDRFTDCMMVDDNWMEGTNMRTGKHGMLPAQYVDTL